MRRLGLLVLIGSCLLAAPAAAQPAPDTTSPVGRWYLLANGYRIVLNIDGFDTTIIGGTITNEDSDTGNGIDSITWGRHRPMARVPAGRHWLFPVVPPQPGAGCGRRPVLASDHSDPR